MKVRRARMKAAAALLVLACGCGGRSSGGDAFGEAEADLERDESADAREAEAMPDLERDEEITELDAGEERDADAADADAIDAGDAADLGEEEPPEYARGSLASCLLDPACRRVCIISHMGAWTASIPGNSMAAYRRAWELGADAIEADVRVTRDGVPFMIHDDEITLYESIMCAGRVVSESTAEEIDDCLLVPSLTETIPSFDEFVTWAAGRILIHLDIKESAHIPLMVEEIISYGAEDFVFIAVSTGEAASVLPDVPDADSVYYLLRVGSVADVDYALSEPRRPSIFMLEGDRTWDDPPVDEAAMMVQVERVHEAGLRMMASSDTYFATVENHAELFDMGFDCVLSYDTENGVEAARLENASRGYPP